MTAPKIPAAAAPATAPGAGAATPPSCAHVAAPGPVCSCGHVAVVHDLARDNRTRKACTVHTGPKGTPCGCPKFDEEVS